jgi:hypothetical protein
MKKIKNSFYHRERREGWTKETSMHKKTRNEYHHWWHSKVRVARHKSKFSFTLWSLKNKLSDDSQRIIRKGIQCHNSFKNYIFYVYFNSFLVQHCWTIWNLSYRNIPNDVIIQEQAPQLYILNMISKNTDLPVSQIASLSFLPPRLTYFTLKSTPTHK